MTHGILHTHAVLPKQFKCTVKLELRCGKHTPIARRDYLSGMKGKTCDIPMWHADRLPFPVNLDLTAGSASCILDQWDTVAPC